MWDDAKYAVRLLLRQPLFTITAILALAMGLGSSTAIFSIINSVLLQPLPYREPDRLYMMWGRSPAPQHRQASISPADFEEYAAQSTSFSHLCAVHNYSTTWTGRGEPVRVFTTLVSPDYFDMLGVRPLLGRTFVAEEGKLGSHFSTVLTHGFWVRHFGGDPNVVGRTMNLGGESFKIVGVLNDLPGDYHQAEIYTPLAFTPEELTTRAARFLSVIGRLKPGVPVAQAEAELATIAGRLGISYADSNSGWTVYIKSLRDEVTEESRPALIVLAVAVLLVLLITCANLASLLLVRASGRRKEVAIRASMGAPQSRVVRQLLTESAVLGLAGGAAGLPIAYGVLRSIQMYGPAGMPRLEQASLSPGVLLFTFLLSLATGFLFGMAPAWQTLRVNLSSTLREESRGSSMGTSRSRGRAILVIAEVALSGILLVCAGLLIRTLFHLTQSDPGFQSGHVLTMRTTLPDSKYSTHEQIAGYAREVLRHIEEVPGVTSAAITTSLPMMNVDWHADYLIEGRPEPPPGQRQAATYNTITPKYFEIMGIRLLRGRSFTERDTEDAPAVIIVSDSFARQEFGGEDPIGRYVTIKVSKFTTRVQVVGVVVDVRHLRMDEPPRVAIYQPHAQLPWPFLAFAIRTSGDPAKMAPVVRKAVLEVDSSQPVDRVMPMKKLMEQSISQQRLAMVLLLAFAILAVMLAAIGLYGVIAYSVAQRGREIGIRMALGAGSSDVVSMVLRQGMMLTAAGLVAGMATAPIAAHGLRDMLSGVTPFDPMTFLTVPVLLSVIALIACYIPARRAVRVDPNSALRYD